MVIALIICIPTTLLIGCGAMYLAFKAGQPKPEAKEVAVPYSEEETVEYNKHINKVLYDYLYGGDTFEQGI